jgi:putative addiction module component (TIGR02574 family)
MNLEQTIADLSELSVNERLQVVQRLWDSIPPETSVQLSTSQKTELERRVAEHDANPDSSLSREEVEARLKSSN